MKRIIKGLLLTSSMFMFTNAVSAATANISVSSSSKNVVVGNKFKVTTNVSSSDLGAWKYCISYDSSVLKLEDSTADAGSCVKAGVIGQTGKTETWTFKAIKSGNSKVTVRAYAVYSLESEDLMSTSVGSVTISAKTQAEIQASYSKNNRLKSLSIEGYDFDKSFNNDIKEYNVSVPSEVTSVNIIAQVEDGTANVSGTGVKDVIEGLNTFDIVVTAQNGTSTSFKINVNVEDQNPIKIDYDGEEYTLIKRAGLFEPPKGFIASTVKINDVDVPSLTSDILDKVLVGFKNSDGKVILFEYKDGEYSKYVAFTFNDITLNIIKMDKSKLPDNYKSFKETINEEELEVYKSKKSSKFALVYGIDVTTGEKDLYQIDLKNNTVQRYNDETTDVIKDNNQKSLMIFGILGGVIFLEFLIILAFKHKNKKILNIIKNDKINKVKKEAIKESKEESIDKKELKTTEIDVDKVEEEIIDDNSKAKKKKKKSK